MLLLAIILILIFGGLALGYFTKEEGAESFGFGAMLTGVVLFVLYFLVAVVWTGIQYHNASNIENSKYVVEELERQRDVYAAVLEDALTTDEYAQLLDAQTPDEIQWLKQDNDITAFMLGRADRVVSLNSRLYAERNDLLDRARSVCNFRANPIIPQLPFFRPDCKLGELEDVFISADLPVKEDAAR